MTTRSDRIFNILETNSSKMKVATILQNLSEQEGAPDLHPSAVTTAVRWDNQSKDTLCETRINNNININENNRTLVLAGLGFFHCLI